MLVVDHLIGLTSPTAALRRAIRLNERGRVAESFRLLTHAAKAGIVDAEYRVAKSYLEGTGVPPSRAEGARWLRRAASHGCVDAQALLSALYVHGLVKAAGDDPVDGGPRADHLFASEAPAEPDFESAVKWAVRRQSRVPRRVRRCAPIS
jgi:TPR repeat protein